jgi:hypothetical protein
MTNISLTLDYGDEDQGFRRLYNEEVEVGAKYTFLYLLLFNVSPKDELPDSHACPG